MHLNELRNGKKKSGDILTLEKNLSLPFLQTFLKLKKIRVWQ